MEFITTDDLGRISFDSRVATAGVCLGIFATNSSGWTTLDFPDFPTQSGFLLNPYSSQQGFQFAWGWNRDPGYLRFSVYGYGLNVALFAR